MNVGSALIYIEGVHGLRIFCGCPCECVILLITVILAKLGFNENCRMVIGQFYEDVLPTFLKDVSQGQTTFS